MGCCSGTKKGSYRAMRFAQPKPEGKTVKFDKNTLDKVLSQDQKILKLDLQFKEEHRDFVNTAWTGKNGAIYARFRGLDNVEILLNDKEDDSANTRLVDVIRNQFPPTIDTFMLKSLSKEPQLSKPYIDALNYSRTMVTKEFCLKNLAIDGATFGTILATYFDIK